MSAGKDDAEPCGREPRDVCQRLLDDTERLFSGLDQRWRRSSLSKGRRRREREFEKSAARIARVAARIEVAEKSAARVSEELRFGRWHWPRLTSLNRCSTAAAVLIEQVRRKACGKYIKFRRLRAPKPIGAAGRIAYCHDDELHGAFEAIATEAYTLMQKGLAGSDGGRHGIVAALAVASKLIERTPMRDVASHRALLEPLGLLQDALLQLDNGVALPMLKPAKLARSGPPPNRSREEFRRRCTIAAKVQKLAGARAPFDAVFAAARETALIVGPFQESNPKPLAGNAVRGARVFSPNTVRNWCEEHTTASNKHNEQDPRASTSEIDMEVMKASINPSPEWRELVAAVWTMALAPAHFAKSMQQITDEILAMRGVRRPHRG